MITYYSEFRVPSDSVMARFARLQIEPQYYMITLGDLKKQCEHRTTDSIADDKLTIRHAYGTGYRMHLKVTDLWVN